MHKRNAAPNARFFTVRARRHMHRFECTDAVGARRERLERLFFAVRPRPPPRSRGVAGGVERVDSSSFCLGNDQPRRVVGARSRRERTLVRREAEPLERADCTMAQLTGAARIRLWRDTRTTRQVTKARIARARPRERPISPIAGASRTGCAAAGVKLAPPRTRVLHKSAAALRRSRRRARRPARKTKEEPPPAGAVKDAAKPAPRPRAELRPARRNLRSRPRAELRPARRTRVLHDAREPDRRLVTSDIRAHPSTTLTARYRFSEESMDSNFDR